MGRGADPTLAAVPRQDARRPTRPLELLIRDPRLAAQRQVMIDFDSTIFPLIDAMADHPLGSEITYEVIQRYEDLPKACGGIERMLRIFDEVMGYRAMRSYAPFPGAPDAINRLAQRGFAVHVVSNRETPALKMTWAAGLPITGSRSAPWSARRGSTRSLGAGRTASRSWSTTIRER